MTAPLMPKATAIWLVENTALTFDQISEFCQLHILEIQAIADGESGGSMIGLDPITAGQLSDEEIKTIQKMKKKEDAELNAAAKEEIDAYGEDETLDSNTVTF